METQLKELFGAWIQAIGTVTAAIGSTPSLNENTQQSLNLWGNVLQGTGNALIADAEEELTLGKLGNEVQAIGNTTVVAGILLNNSEENKLKLDINGNLLQAVGGGIALPEDLIDEPSTIRTLNITGNVLQIIGNSLQAFGGAEELKSIRENEDRFKGYRESNESKQVTSSQTLAINGSWIQAVGSVISAIAQTRESIEEID
ncbi:hypothetical protein QFZ28_002773 [Neobacillus niacini]|uniref:DUF6944 family repetitive protein n=1 Tax=Neobacillus niacini TaxID=86668 RepID=UPI002787620A|nr:hypothetical protein [Neobacillus niacini]MDQ1002373.1 hypothetical protein [Neobacillus niacini]